MRILYSPFIDHTVKLETVEANLEGEVVLRGNIKGKSASLTLDINEALKIFRDLKAMDIEGMAKVFGS